MPTTNRGAKRIFDIVYRGATPPTTFYLMLLQASPAPSVDTNLVSDVAEIAAGNGYTSGGIAVARTTTDFPTLTENDTNDRVELLLKSCSFGPASGGNIPASGAGASYAALTDDNGTIANREIWDYWPLTGAPRTATAGNSITLTNLEKRGATV